MGDSRPAGTIETHVAGDGYTWHYRRYPATGVPKAHVVCIHGIQSHGGWYEYSCGRLSQAGYTVSFLDRRGCGVNEHDRGDAPSFRRLLDDLAEFLRPLRGSTDPRSSIPLFLVAISWGGKLGVALQRRHPGLVDGLALLCPGLFPKVRPSFFQRWGIALSRLVRPRKLFPIPLTEPELFTASPRWQQFIRADPLALRQATARLLIESLRLDGYLRLFSRCVEVPVLLMLAQQDRIIDNERTRRYVSRFPVADREIVEYPDMQHTLEFEPDPDRFIDDLLAWLDRHSQAALAKTAGRP